jgi:hypothetical protein
MAGPLAGARLELDGLGEEPDMDTPIVEALKLVKTYDTGAR